LANDVICALVDDVDSSGTGRSYTEQGGIYTWQGGTGN
jgi:hypothetical protein